MFIIIPTTTRICIVFSFPFQGCIVPNGPNVSQFVVSGGTWIFPRYGNNFQITVTINISHCRSSVNITSILKFVSWIPTIGIVPIRLEQPKLCITVICCWRLWDQYLFTRIIRDICDYNAGKERMLIGIIRVDNRTNCFGCPSRYCWTSLNRIYLQTIIIDWNKHFTITAVIQYRWWRNLSSFCSEFPYSVPCGSINCNYVDLVIFQVNSWNNNIIATIKRGNSWIAADYSYICFMRPALTIIFGIITFICWIILYFRFKEMHYAICCHHCNIHQSITIKICYCRSPIGCLEILKICL